MWSERERERESARTVSATYSSSAFYYSGLFHCFHGSFSWLPQVRLFWPWFIRFPQLKGVSRTFSHFLNPLPGSLYLALILRQLAPLLLFLASSKSISNRLLAIPLSPRPPTTTTEWAGGRAGALPTGGRALSLGPSATPASLTASQPLFRPNSCPLGGKPAIASVRQTNRG
jgi:hypothetical protein